VPRHAAFDSCNIRKRNGITYIISIVSVKNMPTYEAILFIIIHKL